MTQPVNGETDDDRSSEPAPIAERWADADQSIVVRSGPTMGRMSYPRIPFDQEDEPAN